MIIAMRQVPKAGTAFPLWTGQRAFLGSVVILICLLCHTELASTFSVLPFAPQQRQNTIQRSSSFLASSSSSSIPGEATRRAGSDGYSVLRQPASRTSWNPDYDPDFDVPSSLTSNEDSPQQLDDEWWSNHRIGQGRRSGSSLIGTAETRKETRRKESSTPVPPQQPEDLDLLQRSLDTLDYPRVLKALEAECTTVPARNLVRNAFVALSNNNKSSSNPGKKIPRYALQAYQPLTAETVQGSQERYSAVQEMEWVLRGGHGVHRLNDYWYRNRKGYKESLAGRPPPLGGNSFDLESLLEHASTQGRVLESDDILQISSMMDTLENVLCWSKEGLEQVKEIAFVELPKLTACITLNTTLQDLLHNAFDDEGRLSGTTFPMVGRLRARVRDLKKSVMDTLDSLLTLPSIKSKLALESGGPTVSEVSGGRLVIPLDAASHARAPVGIVHDSSRSGKTVYVEPSEIVGPTNELASAAAELRAEEARVWRSLTRDILDNRVALEASVAAVGQLDLVLARILLGRQLSGVIPTVGDEGIISVRNAKHPILLLRHVRNVVGSDVELGVKSNQGLVLTGPNSGGKTIILKMLGLFALMARAGIPIPADQAKQSDDMYGDSGNEEETEDIYHPRVDFFNPVLADIGDIQSVGGDLSTFSGHMLVCREVLANAGKNALVLMDEVGSGTDPAQGVAIAQALLEALMETGARVAITTHYMQLKQLAASDERFAVAGMQFVGGRPTYRLLPGTVGESFALAVAERLNLPASVIERANELLDSETRQMGDLIRDLEDQKVLLEKQAVELEERRKEMASMEFKIKEETLRLEKKHLSARRDEAKRFASKLEEKERVLEDILEKLKNDPSRRIVAKSWDDIKFVKREALNEAENVPSVMARKKQAVIAMDEASAELVPLAEMRERPDLKEGDSVVICKKGPLFGREAEITKDFGGRVEVRVNNMTVGLKLTEVALPNKRSSSPQARGSKKSGVPSVSRAAEKAIAAEMNGSRSGRDSSGRTAAPTEQASISGGGGLTMKTQSNTIDVLGCTMEQAKEKIMVKFSASLLVSRPVVYILHGHGTGGVLKSKIRDWLKSERQLVKKWGPADASDGGDALTRVELR